MLAGDMSGAVARFSSGIVAAGEFAPIRTANLLVDRARAYTELGNLAAARTDLDRAMQLAPSDPAAAMLSAALARRQQDLPRARADIAKAAALAECPDGRELEVGTRLLRRTSGMRVRSGRGRRQIRLASWLVTRLVTARLTTPRAAPRLTDWLPNAPIPAAMANHSLEWSAALVRRGIVESKSGLGDSATASKTSRSKLPRPLPIARTSMGLKVSAVAEIQPSWSR